MSSANSFSAFAQSVVLAAFAGFAAGGAMADPYVIPGVGLPDAGRAPVAVPVAPRGGGLGGGFIELLATGGASPGGYYAPPRRRVAAYGAVPQFEMQRQVDPMFLRTQVEFPTNEPRGTIVIDTPRKFLYFVEGGGRAIRYGVGVGRPGFEWSGVKSVSRKAEWPDWTPPAEMLSRRPDLPRHMDGGPANPLGARALYLGSSLYRIHGTNEPFTIGQNVSSGCIRMMNEDVIDLYNRTPIGARVVVR